MVQFGNRLEAAKKKEWTYTDYEKLKQLLKLARKAHAAAGEPPLTELHNFGRPTDDVELDGDFAGNVGLFELRFKDGRQQPLAESLLRVGLSDEERQELIALRQSNVPGFTAVRPDFASAASTPEKISRTIPIPIKGDPEEPPEQRASSYGSTGARLFMPLSSSTASLGAMDYSSGGTAVPPRRPSSPSPFFGSKSDTTIGHWSRWFVSRTQMSFALLVHGFDVALVAELEKVEALYERELGMLRQRWDHHIIREERETRQQKLREEGQHLVSAPSLLIGLTRQRSIFNRGPPTLPLVEEHKEGGGKKKKKKKKKEKSDQVTEGSLQRAMAQLDSDTRELIDFAVWNYAAFVKITKKRDKMLKSLNAPSISHRFCALLRGAEIWSASSARRLGEEIKGSYASLFCDNDLTSAELQLNEKRLDAQSLNAGSFGFDVLSLRLGYRCGVAVMLFAWVIWDCFEQVGEGGGEHHNSRGSVASKPAWPIFRACGELTAWHWMWGISLHVWAVHRVNVEYLFDYVDSKHGFPTARDVFDEAATETIVLLASMLAYYKSTYKGGLPVTVTDHIEPDIISSAVPLCLVLYATCKMFFPWSRRKHLWRTLWRVVQAPCREVRFVDTYSADVLTSMVKILQDGLWTACYVSSGAVFVSPKAFRHVYFKENATFLYRHILAPTVSLLPVWFRFAQCLRKFNDVGSTPKRWVHLWNASKYALSLFVSLCTVVGGGPVNDPFWFALFIVSSLYSWCWDVFVDWGLRPNLGIRMFDRRWYLTAAFFDIFGRFFWLATLVPPYAVNSRRLLALVPEGLYPLLALMELCRRCVWGFFRLEHEHVSNAFHGREEQFVPSLFRRKPGPEAPRRTASFFEALFIAALVLSMLARVSLNAAKTEELAHAAQKAAESYHHAHDDDRGHS